MKNYNGHGRSLTVTATATVASGSFQIVGVAFGVAATAAAIGEDYELQLGGEYTLPKNATQALTGGAAVYWDAVAGNVTTTSAGNTKIGVATKAALAAATSSRIRLNDTF